jgi:hypothetical protein
MGRGLKIFLSALLNMICLQNYLLAIPHSVEASNILGANPPLDSISLCVKIIDCRLENGQWVDFQYRNFKYDESNLVAEYLISQFVHDSITRATRIFNSYDRRGHLAGQTGQQRIYGIWQNIEGGCRMEYDSKGNLVKYMDYALTESGEDTVSVIDTYYDDAGKEIRRTHRKGAANAFISDNVTKYILNDRSQVTEKISEIRKDSNYVPINKIMYHYDDLGQIVEEDGYTLQKFEWVNNHRKLYTYNDVTRTTEEISQSLAFGKWMNENRIVTYLDAYGNISEVEAGGYSSEKGWQIDHRITYEYIRVPTILPVFNKPIASNVDTVLLPEKFRLDHNYPNPFNATTQIHFYVPFTANVSLKVYDILGREVATLIDEERQSGEYSILWDGKDVATGVYFYRMVALGFSEVRKMNLVK